MAPVWDSPLWDAIQEGDYAMVESRFAELLKGELTPEEWSYVYWEGILAGIDSFRGEVDILIWNTVVLPALTRAILQAATPKNLETILLSLPLNRTRSFIVLAQTSIPGKDSAEKKAWLKEKNPALFPYLLNALFSFSFEGKGEGFLLPQGAQRAEALTLNLSFLLFSTTLAETIKSIGDENKLNEDQTHSLAVVAGNFLLGFTKFSNLPSEIKTKTNLPDDQAALIGKTLGDRLFGSSREEIEVTYTPTTSSGGAAAGKSGEMSATGVPSKQNAQKSEYEVTRNTAVFPLPSTPNKTIPKSFSGGPGTSFFKPRPAPEEETPVEEAAVGPVIIHQETKAEGLSTAPKLGFRTEMNKLPGARNRPEPLKAAQFTTPNDPAMKESAPKVDGIKAPTAPMPSLGAKLTIGKEVRGTAPASASSVGFLGKIKTTISKVVSPLTPLTPIGPKGAMPPPPPPPPKDFPLPTRAGISTAPVSMSEIRPANKPVPSISPLPRLDANTPPAGPTPSVLSDIAPKAGVTTTGNTVKINLPTPSLGGVEVKKISTTSQTSSPLTPAPITPAQPKEKTGFFGRLFRKKPEETKNVFTPPASHPVIVNLAEITKSLQKPATPNVSPVVSAPTPVPPPAPAAPRAVTPPTFTPETKPPLPSAQKVSPLSNFNSSSSVNPTPTSIPASASLPNPIPPKSPSVPKVVHYSEYSKEQKN